MSEKDEGRVERGPSMQLSEALGMAMLLERAGQTGAAAIMREQHAEIERLWAERDADRRRDYGYSQETVDALTKERDALRADAERYRYLLGHARRIDVAGWSISHMEQLSPRIDAAREES